MSHDMLAELAGYRAELAGAEQHGESDRAEAIRGEIDRISAAVRGRVDELRAEATAHESNGQDVLAVNSRIEARRLAAGLPDDEPPGTETATDKSPRETATTKRGRNA